mmetsp:Transcript_6367/g.21337  ORF Transcript_6367/g.21337 Transcript_6367/m.21337 type:complete len:226 (+) Transcript_6367:6471-7148(+)
MCTSCAVPGFSWQSSTPPGPHSRQQIASTLSPSWHSFLNSKMISCRSYFCQNVSGTLSRSHSVYTTLFTWLFISRSLLRTLCDSGMVVPFSPRTSGSLSTAYEVPITGESISDWVWNFSTTTCGILASLRRTRLNAIHWDVALAMTTPCPFFSGDTSVISQSRLAAILPCDSNHVLTCTWSPHRGYSLTTMCRRVHTHAKSASLISTGMDCARPQIPCAWLHAHS